ncbi:MAG: ABC1 kinase family protein [Nannocystaceae bacterium]
MDDDLQGIRRSWAKRLWSTGKIATSAARLAGRQLVGLEGARDGTLGEALVHELDQMKGMAMKVGQILSYFDGILPEETHRALRSLQTGQRGVSFDVMAEVIQTSLGAPVDELFDHFDSAPVASASIGQVYRAVVRGQDVAVKVQYPGIRDTIEGDFSRLQALSKLASLATAVDGPALVHELRERFCEECNYKQEAESLRLFRAAFADDPTYVIPDVVATHTGESVLTMQWCPGKDFYKFIEDATQEQRNQAAEKLVVFAYRSLFEYGMLNADPHPGNYLFPEDNTVVFLDFGCIRHFDRRYLAAQRQLMKVILENRRAEFREALTNIGEVAKVKGFNFDYHWSMYCHLLAPYREPDFVFTKDYLRKGMDFGNPRNPNLRKIAIDPQWIWIQRLQWGLHAVLHKLGGRADFGGILASCLNRPIRQAVAQ